MPTAEEMWAKLYAETVYVVTATDFEQLALWREHAIDSPWRGGGGAGGAVAWEQMNPGNHLVIGESWGHPVAVEVTWARIEGRVVAFVHPSSQVVDWPMVEAWRTRKMPAAHGHCDAMNFGHCLRAIRDAIREAAKPEMRAVAGLTAAELLFDREPGK